MFCMCFTLSPVSVSANKKVGMTGGDVDELRHDENEYADVIFKGQVKGETDKPVSYTHLLPSLRWWNSYWSI